MTVSYNNFESSLISKNIKILSKRTSLRLEPEMWRELNRITEIEKCSINDLASLIYIRKNSKASLTSSIRVFVMLYYRAASTNKGHEKVGHGDFTNMLKRAGVTQDWQKLTSQALENEVQVS